ncbi:MAG: hypothetical protein WB217_17265 [Mesobacillus sp.]
MIKESEKLSFLTISFIGDLFFAPQHFFERQSALSGSLHLQFNLHSLQDL